MDVIRARNVCQALPEGLRYLLEHGREEDSRAGRVIVAPNPVTTVYMRPQERVLISPVRDANPFFHLFEALWMLAGRRDAKFLDLFVKDFSERFAEDNGSQWGAYGHRWRRHFDDPVEDLELDQVKRAVELLKSNPTSRQVVITMWDPQVDMNDWVRKDRPCNTHIYLRIRRERVEHRTRGELDRVEYWPMLDMTVLCRSNDIIWGAYGANAVHFSVLQEYLAAHIGSQLGTLYQVSNNYHAYLVEVERLMRRMEVVPDGLDRRQHLPSWLEYNPYHATNFLKQEDTIAPAPLVSDPETFDQELETLLTWVQNGPTDTLSHPNHWKNDFLTHTAWPMAAAHAHWRSRNHRDALGAAGFIRAPDWKRAAVEWLERRRPRAT